MSVAIRLRGVGLTLGGNTILRRIDLDIARGTIVGLVGESGSGKTSLGRVLLRLIAPSAGTIHAFGHDITSSDGEDLRPLRARMQMVFQDPLSALNPRHSIERILLQARRAHGMTANRAESRKLLELVQLPDDLLGRFPHQLSGGQRQRVGIARALSVEPDLVVADEITSGLDKPTELGIIKTLTGLQRSMNIAVLFISHDLDLVSRFCDEVAVMHRGKIVEYGSAGSLFNNPRQPYTRELIAAIPTMSVDPTWLDQETKRGNTMELSGKTVLITGANRGIGEALVKGFLDAGAAKIYAATRNAGTIGSSDPRVEELVLDVTKPDQIDAALEAASDVTILINNAGVNHNQALIHAADLSAARSEIEVNYFGTAAMCRAFAPVLAANGGGAIVNILSILARVNLPLMGSLCASKAAGLSLTQAVRAELNAQGTVVLAVMPGAVDTRMTENFPPPKMPPSEVAASVIEALRAGLEEVYPGDMAQGVVQGLSHDPKAVEQQFAGYLPG